MKKIGTLILLFCTINAFCQKPLYITDSIMQLYKENGYAARNFQSGGKTDAKKMQQGMWADYKIEQDFICYAEDGTIKQLFGNYLMYGEGNYYNGRRSGTWKLYLIEDKTFKKVLLKEVTYKNGAKEGAFTYLLPDGKIGVTGSYHLDKIDGTFTNYYTSGAVCSEHDYSIGMLNGSYTFYYEDGKIKSDGTYTNNIKNGMQKVFYHTGQLQEVSNLIMGLEDGLYQCFYTNGKLCTEKEYKAGMLMAVKGNFTSDGIARDKGSLKKGNGTVINYNPDGTVYNVQTYKGGKLVSADNKLADANFKK